MKADDLEERRAKEAERLIEVKQRIARAGSTAGVTPEGVPEGMVVAEGIDDDEVEVEGDVVEGPLAKKAPARKTKQQRSKAARQLVEVGPVLLSLQAQSLTILAPETCFGPETAQ